MTELITYIIVLKQANYKERFIEFLNKLNIQYEDYQYLSKLLRVDVTSKQYNQIKNSSLISSIEYNAEGTILSKQTIDRNNSNIGLDRIDQRSPELNGVYRCQRTGTGVDVYVFDTGINFNHKEFGGRALFLHDAVNEDFFPNGLDGNSHGTHVAGIIGGSNFGVAKNVTLYAVKVLNRYGKGTISSFMSGVNSVIAHHNSKNSTTFSKQSVANMSMGFNSVNVAVDSAIDDLVNNGIITCVAAGNEADDANNYSPARVRSALTVGAISTINNVDTIAYFSNTEISNPYNFITRLYPDDNFSKIHTNIGSAVDIFAPGFGIKSSSSLGFSQAIINTDSEHRIFLNRIGKKQKTLLVNINTQGTDNVPYIKIGTDNDNSLLLDAGPEGSARETILAKNNSSQTFQIEHTFNESTNLYVYYNQGYMSDGRVIVSLLTTSTTEHTTKSGTSMACPHVAGVVALRLEEEPVNLTNAAEVKEIHDWIIDISTKDTINDLPYGTPNRVLYMPYNIGNEFVWDTDTNLGSFSENKPLSVFVKATFINDSGNEEIPNYSTRNLPSFLEINNNTGEITGIAPYVSKKVEHIFYVTASFDNYSSEKQFILTISDTINQAPTWYTDSNLGVIYENDSSTNLPIVLRASDPDGDRISYELITKKQLPEGLTLSSNGLISGMVTSMLVDKEFSFIIRARDNTHVADKTFFLKVIASNGAPIWSPSGHADLGSFENGSTLNIDLKTTPIYASDPDNDTIYFSLNLQEGESIPKGLELSSDGIISGTISEAGTFTFTVSATDTVLTANKQLSIYIIDVTLNLPPIWITPEGSIGEEDENMPVTLFVQAYDPENKDLVYELDLEFSDEFPPGLMLEQSGRIIGVTQPVIEDTRYQFRIKASDDKGKYSHRRFSFTVKNVIIDLLPVWYTEKGSLGSIYEQEASHFEIYAEDPEGGSVYYQKTSGNLPPGLDLNISTGEITGIVYSVMEDTTFTFGVVLIDGTQRSLEREFSITVLKRFSSFALNVTIPLMRYHSTVIEDRLSKILIFDDVYRPNDPNFGIVRDFEIGITSGLNLLPDNIDNFSTIEFPNIDEYVAYDFFAMSLNTYHFKTSIILSKIDYAVARDDNGNILYEVIYVDLLDPQSDAKSSNEGTVPYSNNTKGITEITPNSIFNMKNEILKVYSFENGTELLPRWMSSEQILGDVNSVIGWKPVLVLAYLKPNTGYKFIKQLTDSNKRYFIENYVIDIDRFRIDTSIESFGTTFDCIFDHDFTKFDNKDRVAFNKYIKFPNKSIERESENTGDILDINPAI